MNFGIFLQQENLWTGSTVIVKRHEQWCLPVVAEEDEQDEAVPGGGGAHRSISDGREAARRR
jgi:hypothetical protein